MKTLARVTFGLVFAALTSIVPMSAANATCSLEIYADRAYSDGSLAYVYGSTTSLGSFYVYGDTGNSMLASLFFAATAQRTKIYVTGSAASCPTSGTSRYIGLISSAAISP